MRSKESERGWKDRGKVRGEDWEDGGENCRTNEEYKLQRRINNLFNKRCLFVCLFVFFWGGGGGEGG